MPRAFSDLIALVTSDAPADSAALAAGLVDARFSVSEAEADHAAADAAYREGLLGDEKALAKLAAIRSSAEVKRDRASALLARLEEHHAAAVSGEAETVRIAAYDAARSARDEAAAAVSAEYPGLVARILELVAVLAEADAAVEAVNADLPAGAEMLLSAEMIARHIPGLPREDISDRTVELWCREGEDRPIPESMQGRVFSQEDGTGYYSTDTGRHAFVKRRFRRVAYRPATPSQHIARLASSLALPPLRPGELLTWTPEDWQITSPRVTLAKLAAIKAAGAITVPAAPAAREVRVELVPVAAPDLVRPEGQHVASSGYVPRSNINARFTLVDVERNPDAADAA